MKKYLFSFFLLLILTQSFSQTGVMDNFDDNVLDPNWKFLLSCPAPAAPCYVGTESNSELQVVTNAVGPAYENFEFQFPAIDLTANPVVTINVKNGVAFNMRIDLTDINGYATNASPTVVAIPVSASYVQYTFNFAGKFSQTTPTTQTVDITKIVKVVFFVNPGGTATSTSIFLNDLIVGNPPAPVAGFSSSTSTICTGATVTFTNTSNSSVSSYAWNFGTGATPATSTTYGPQSVTWSSTGSKTITLTVTGPGGTNTMTSTITVNGVPSAAGTISGSSSQCLGSSATYSLAAVTGATGYTWSLPSGASITAGNNTNNVTISFGSSSGNISVTPTNSCGNGNVSPNLPITINPSVSASVSITASPSNFICSGSSVTFTASPVNGGSNPTYQWKINGTNVAGQTNSTFTTNTLANGQIVTVTMNSNAPCVSGSPATSNPITMSVSSNGAPTISISTTTPTICSGGVVVFSTTVTNGGPSPTFVWKQNGVVIAGEDNDSLMAILVNDQDVFSAVVTASGCTSGSANSNLYTISVLPGNLVNVFATTNSDSVCIGVPTTFTATPTNGGSNPVYQWQVNGVNVGTNSPTYTSSFNSNATVTVNMTSNSTATCLVGNPATSTPLNIKAASTMTSSVQITSTATTICSGLPVTFTATPGRNAGTNPSYQWKVNGANQGSNSPTFSSSSLANNDKVTCVMTPSITCAQPSTSNAITITVTTTVAPSLTISTPSSSICTGSSATFTATPVNGGSSPSYDWQINGVSQSSVLSTFTPGSISNGDVIKCILTSNLSCASTPNATSNLITMTVNPLVTPTISISASSTTICPGTSVTFTASVTNGGSAPTFVWKENGIPTGATGSTYTVANLVNNEQITCEMTPNHPCAPSTVVVSNTVTMTVTPAVSAQVNISSSPLNACPATATTFTAVPTNGGSTPVYQWKLNGSNVGTNSNTYSNSTLAAGDVITVVMTSNAACAIGSPATSNTVTVSPSTTATISIAASANPVCTGTTVDFTSVISGGGLNPTYIWKKNNIAIPSATSADYSTSTLANNDVITCQMTSSAACAIGSPVTATGITMSVTAVPSTSVTISTSTPSICGGSTATFNAAPVNAGSSPNYQWQVNGQNVGSNLQSYSSSTLANGDVVRVIMTSSAACAGSTSTSNSITMTVSNPPSTANAGSDQYVTSNTATLSAIPTASGSGQWTTSSGATINFPGQASSTVTNLATGANTFTWTVSSGVCPTSTDNVVINYGSKPSTKTITGPVNVKVDSTGVTYFVSPIQAGSSYSWVVSGATIASGQGTNSITVDFGSSAGGVDIFLTEFNNYGDYTTTLHVNTGLPPTQKTISGPDYATINSTGITYSIPANGSSTYSWTVTGASPVTGTSNSINLNFGGTPGSVTLSVTETNAFGSMTATKTVTVGSAPATPIILGPDSVVVGTSVNYTVALHSGSTYLWPTPAGNVTITGTTTNTVTVTFNTSGSYNLVVIETNSNGSATGTKTGIKAGTVAVVSSISGNAAVISGVEYTYTAITDAGGHSVFYWSLPPGTTIVSGNGTATIKVIFPADITTGTISVTQDNGFGTSSTSLPITISPNGIFHNTNNAIAYTMFPNPFLDVLKLTFNTPVSSNLNISILNMNGQVVFSGSEYFTNQTIELGKELPAGLYMIKAMSDAKIQVIKINKE